MEPLARRVSHREIRDAIDDVLAGGQGAMLEAVAGLSVDAAKAMATRILLEKGEEDARRVRLYTDGPWLHIEPAER